MPDSYLTTGTDTRQPLRQRAAFLRAEWRKLAMANYAIDPALLQKYIPWKTEIDIWQETCYVSLVGFMFQRTRLKRIAIPFHTSFEEVNLRFYVRYQDTTGWRRGVVFLKEIVPRPALTFVANRVYGERYETMKMEHAWLSDENDLSVMYRWKKKNWNTFAVTADPTAADITAGSEEEFITEHYWGYTQLGGNRTSEYAVEHPRWKVYPVRRYSVDVDFSNIYGTAFAFLSEQTPKSVFLAEGSEIIVRQGGII